MKQQIGITRLFFVILAVVTVLSLAGCASPASPSGEISKIVLANPTFDNSKVPTLDNPKVPKVVPTVITYNEYNKFLSAARRFENSELEHGTLSYPYGTPDVLAYAVFPSAPKGFKDIRKGYGRIFVLRPHLFFGYGVYPMATFAGNREIIVANGGCVTWEQPAGTCQVRFDRAFYSKLWFDPDPARILPLALDEQAALSLNVHAGTGYYLELRIDEKEGQWHLVELPEIQGQELVAEKFKPVAIVEDRSAVK